MLHMHRQTSTEMNGAQRDANAPHTSAEPVFWVGNVPVYGDLILAPLAGFSDMPYRSLCRRMGSAMSYSECIPVGGLLHGNWRAIEMTRFAAHERPVVLQALGSDPGQIVEACQRLEALGPDIIDINMGCPTPRVAGRGAGAGLLREPAKIAEIMSRLSRVLSIPVTAKIRLGWDNASRNYLEVAHILEDSGAALIAVHGRTRAAKYAAQADWDAIAEIVQAVRIPVVGNGDIKTIQDIARLKAHSGCDAVMIGRGAIGNPWIFARRALETVSTCERVSVTREHFDAMVRFYGEERAVRAFRKHAVRYLRGIPGAAHARAALMTCTERDQVLACLSSTSQCLLLSKYVL